MKKIITPEKTVKKNLMDLLKATRGIAWVERMNSGMPSLDYKGKKRFFMGAQKGTSDIVGMLEGGRTFFIEVKRDGKTPTEEQVLFMERIRKHGGVALVCVGIDGIETTIKALMSSNPTTLKMDV